MHIYAPSTNNDLHHLNTRAKKMSTKFPGSIVLTQNSGGVRPIHMYLNFEQSYLFTDNLQHCSFAAPSICTVKYIAAYFLTGKLPDPETICQPTLPVFNKIITKEQTENTIPLEDNGMQVPLMANLSAEDARILEALMELIGKVPGIVPRLGM